LSCMYTSNDRDTFVPQVGKVYDGKVTKIIPIGAYVELAPGVEGLVHISKLADHRVEMVEDVLRIGDMTWVKLMEIDGRGRLNLSRKDALREIDMCNRNGIEVPKTYQQYERKPKPGEFVPQVGELYDGKVIRILPIGAFVELAPGFEGLVHISKLADHRVEMVEDVLRVGDMTWVKITEIDGRGRINLSRKDALREIDMKRKNGIEVPETYRKYERKPEPGEFVPQAGDVYKGKVTRVLPIGAFVEIAPGYEGLVHISKLADRRVEKVEDVLNIGDMTCVKIIDTDGRGRINLSVKDVLPGDKPKEPNVITKDNTCLSIEKQAVSNPLSPQVGELCKGRVTRILPMGAYVELASGQQGMLHISTLADFPVEEVEDVVIVGDVIWVKILEIDGSGRINLSYKDAQKEIKDRRLNGEMIE